MSILPISGKTKTVYAFGEVTETMSEEFTKEILSTNWDDYEDILLVINSEGGSLLDCFSMIDIITELKKIGKRLTTYATGAACSAGFLLFIMGDKRIISSKCRLFVHEHISFNSEESFKERMENSREEKIIHGIYVDLVAERLGLTKTRALNLLKKNKWLTTKEIADYKIGEFE